MIRMFMATRLGRALALILAGLGAGLWFALRVASFGRLKAKNKALREYADTRKEMDDALEKSHAGGGSWRDRLQRHTAKRDK